MDGANIATAIIAATPGTLVSIAVLRAVARASFDTGKWMGEVNTKLDHLHECVERLKREEQ